LHIYFRYTLFACLAILVNLGTQAFVLHLYSGSLALTVALIFGTGTGLVTKYLLDKRWIFFDPTIGVTAHGRSFTLYTATGLLTTAIFWGLEYAFDGLTPDGRWRYLGGAIGLAIGYAVKFQLDRRFVLSRAERKTAGMA
jgi:putative flippase GtrA